MFTLEFYANAAGVSELWDDLDRLQRRALTDKNARVQHKQIVQYLQLLEDHGTRLGELFTKKLDNDIWELRPGSNRILFFYYRDNTFVLLHMFRKKSKKTPPRELSRAHRERNDWLSRKEMADHGNLDRL